MFTPLTGYSKLQKWSGALLLMASLLLGQISGRLRFDGVSRVQSPFDLMRREDIGGTSSLPWSDSGFVVVARFCIQPCIHRLPLIQRLALAFD